MVRHEPSPFIDADQTAYASSLTFGDDSSNAGWRYPVRSKNSHTLFRRLNTEVIPVKLARFWGESNANNSARCFVADRGLLLDAMVIAIAVAGMRDAQNTHQFRNLRRVDNLKIVTPRFDRFQVSAIVVHLPKIFFNCVTIFC